MYKCIEPVKNTVRHIVLSALEIVWLSATLVDYLLTFLPAWHPIFQKSYDDFMILSYDIVMITNIGHNFS